MDKPNKIKQLNSNILAMSPIGDTHATPKRLREHETAIEKCLIMRSACEFDIGRHLVEIQVEAEFTEVTFEAYMERRFGFKRAHGYRLMDAYKVQLALPEGVKDQLQNESQARALKAAPKNKRAKILKDVVKEGPVTAKAIKERVEQSKPDKSKAVEASYREIVTDWNKEEVPEQIASNFTEAELLGKEASTLAQQIKGILGRDDFTTVESRGLRELSNDLLAGIKTHMTRHVLCPKCAGAKCSVCRKRGFTSRYFATKGIAKPE